MSDIAPISSSCGARAVDAPGFARRTDDTRAPATRRGEDQVEVSEVATYLSKLRQLPIRQDLVDAVREQIARGEYDTSDKLSQALDEMIQDL